MSVPSSPKDARLSPVAGVKRSAPAPSLLPAIDFEPYSSSPLLPRPMKRRACYSPSKYPTPVPTSSTAMPSSSPPRLPPTRRPRIQRTQSLVSERAPLCSVPSVELESNGEPTLMGRSSNSSHYQLSSNSLVSRIHIQAAYVPAAPPAAAKIQISCLGWNGVKIHCRGKVFELAKGDSFNSEKEDIDIMLDVHDARVLVKWPSQEKRKSASTDSESTWDEENSPPRRAIAAVQHRSPKTSPLRQRHRMPSPISPSPAVQAASLSTFLASDPADLIHVYEDEQLDELAPTTSVPAEATQSTHIASQPLGETGDASQSSSLSEPQDFSDQDEENDPIIHSFGPFGDNILPRLASFTAGGTPERSKRVSPESASTVEDETNQVINHVINQLAYSRLSSTPLSTIMNNLPADLKTESPGSKENRKLSVKDLKKMLDTTRCIGEVTREGKDAAGKPLESEYYYVPDADSDEKRRDAVVEGLRKPGLRACRKQHKQYYWRKPKN